MIKKNRPIRLCFILPGAYQIFHSVSQMAHGGAELNLYYLSKMFADNDNYRVSFLVEDQCQKHAEIYQKVRVIKIRGLRWGDHKKTNHKFVRLWWRFLIELSMAYEMLTRHYDIVIATTASALLSRAVFWGQVLGRKKVVFRFANDTDTNPHYFGQTYGQHKKDSVYWWGVKKAKSLVFQTNQQKELFHQYSERDGQIIENGFILEPNTEILNKEYILWVSRAEEVKRPDIFLELAKRFPNRKFVMIMPGKTELSTNIQTMIKQIPNLTFIPYVPFDEIQHYFNRALLFVNTSKFEGFPNTFIQCGIAKTPLLSFCINPDKIIDQYQLGLVCDDSLEKAVEFISKLTTELGHEYGENIWNYTLAHHDIHNTYYRYETLFHELC